MATNNRFTGAAPMILAALESAMTQTGPKTDWTSIDTPIKHDGKEIVLPSDPNKMDYDSAINTLQRVKEQEDQEFDVREFVKGAPWDAAVALFKAMQSLYGVVLSQSQQTWFGEIKPQFVTVITGVRPEDRIQVPIGQVTLPGVSQPVNIGMYGGGCFISGTVRKRDRAILVEITNRAQEILKTDSVYKGKAIRFAVDDEGDLQINVQPEFIDLRNVLIGDMIHTAETAAQINTNIFSPLQNTEACRKHRIPLKRGILLEGRYGTGKSLTARVTAKVAVDNGWTFVMLDRSQGLKAAIEFAKTYQPCVIFAEDIDRAADRSNESVNDLVNMLDGIITKNSEIMTVLTTNFIDKIDTALLRPGRFDAVISIQVPDPETAERLIRAYGRDLIAPETSLVEVGKAIAGQIPASIREVVERAKLSMLMEDRDQLSSDDLLTAALGMKRHMALLEPKTDVQTPRDMFVNGLVAVLAEALGETEDHEDYAKGDQVLRVEKLVKDVHNITTKKLDQQILPMAQAAANSSQSGLENTKRILAKM